jgi:hypothetical protein
VSLEVGQTQTVTVYSQSGDGEVVNQDCATWAECRSATSGDFAYSLYQGATVASSYTANAYAIKRVFLYFDTSAVPANATIQSVTLNVYAGQYQNGPHRRVYVVQSTQGSPLSILDFGRLIFASGGFAALAANTWAQIALNATGQTWIAKGGATRLALVNDLDMNNLAPTEANDSLISMAEDSAHRPYLTVTYTIP